MSRRQPFKSMWGLFISLGLFLVGGATVVGQSPAREAGYLYVSPHPNASYVSPATTNFLVRFAEVQPTEVTNLLTTFISVTGEESGVHTGAVQVASDGRTVILELSAGFLPGEIVTVALNPGLDPASPGHLEPYVYQFGAERFMPGSVPSGGEVLLAGGVPQEPWVESEQVAGGSGGGGASGEVILPNGVSVPSDFPEVTVTVNEAPTPGYVFLETGWASGAPDYTMILDNNGWPVWYRRGRVWDFKVQPNGLITWNELQYGGAAAAFDQDFNPVSTHQVVNGYQTDAHEFLMLEDGHTLMLGRRSRRVDLSQYIPGGATSVLSIEGVIQEFTAAGELIFEWRAWDHLIDALEIASGDFPHMNALDVDEDGHLLLCARHTDEVTKINRDTGEVIWRLGGVSSDFVFMNDPLNVVLWYGATNAISYQHDITALGNSRYLLFDNGDRRQGVNQISRAVEYELDLTNKTATLVWEYRDAGNLYAHRMGNAQRLTNGNTLVNFVMPPYPPVMEVNPAGEKVFELTLSPNTEHYRVFRFPWTGVVARPYLIAEPAVDNVTLLFNKFGDQTVDHYRIYGGTTPGATQFVATSTTTLERLTNVVNGVVNYFRVTAVGTNGVESAYSNEESLLVNLTLPGGNLVLNGDFADDTNAWTWTVDPSATATWSTAGGEADLQIVSGGMQLTDVQLAQVGLSLAEGEEYTLEFEAWSDAPRIIEAQVEEDVSGGIRYSGIQPFTITPIKAKYTFPFTMTSPSDANARLVFNVGALPYDVHLDNITLVQTVYSDGDLTRDGCVGFGDLKVLTDAWQASGAGLPQDVNGDGAINLADFVILSADWVGDGFCP